MNSKRYLIPVCLFLIMALVTGIMLPAAAQAFGPADDNAVSDNGTAASDQAPIDEIPPPINGFIESENNTGEGSPVAEKPEVPAGEDQSAEDILYGVLTSPGLLTSVLIILIFVAVVLYLIWKKKRDAEVLVELLAAEAGIMPDKSSGVKPVMASVARKEVPLSGRPDVKAKLVLPGGNEIKITSEDKTIGREELARVLNLDELGLISRRHFSISYQEGCYYIEDAGSRGGTSVNDVAVKSGERREIKDGDQIKLSDSAILIFQQVQSNLPF